MKLPELLAPVGNMNHLKLAVYNGASSIYLSGKEFGARKYAENFNIDEIEKAVKFAHLYNVKVYVTVNILIKESEIKEVINYLIDLYNIGVDAVLVQDIGLIKIIHEILPNFPIHASTQLNIHNIEGVDWAKSQGIKRIVLPRELRIDEVKEITEYAHKNNIETEIFVHGALCYSYSGHCLLSSYIGGRSGNRGTCAQPCRQKYTVSCENGENLDENFLIELSKNYPLSPKDLSLYKDLDKILFVDSLKIEGRMRNEDYVSTVVHAYRQGLNKLKHNKRRKDNEELSLVFNRQFTRGHLFDNPNKIINYKKPSNNGLYIGNVKEFNGKNIIKINQSSHIIPDKGDIILIEGKSLENNSKASYGFELSVDSEVQEDTLILKTIRENKNIDIKIDNESKVYITKRNKISNKTKQALTGKNKSYKKSILNLDFKINKNNYPIIKSRLKLGNGKIIKYKYKAENKWEEAKNKPISSKQIENNLRKIDHLPFYIGNININYLENLFTPISNLNKLRRDFYNNLVKEIEESYLPKNIDKIKENSKKFKDNYYKEKFNKKIPNKDYKLSVYLNSLEQLKELNNKKSINRIYLEIPEKNMNFLFKNHKEKFNINYCVNFLKEAYSISKNQNYELIWKWPEIATKDTLNGLFKTYGILSKLGVNLDIMTSILGIDEILKNHEIKAYGSQYLNIYNSQSVKNLNNFDILTISPELSKNDIKELSENSQDKLEMIVGGTLEAMITRKPILRKKDIKNIKKKLNIKITKDTDLNISIKNIKNEYYPVKSTISQELLILYNKKLSLLNKLNELKEFGIKNYAIDLRWENKYNINNIIDLFNEGIKNKLDDNTLEKLNNNLEKYWLETSNLNYNKKLL
ncbi:peptidase U32 family protein [Methanobrevibacter wolinii]|uniref:peptidase U32 family protein n=1 Tax=Methanobrevibacter wolinii TaxID=190977 RepID=UPI0006941915|nr:U32 family peptidase [Methanobrevibacter wolinii]